MKEKPAFPAAHNCICAYDDDFILDFYKGYFDAVYIILHPFERTDNQDKLSQMISWLDVLKLTGFQDIKQLDIALRNRIGGLTAKYKNNTDVDRLIAVCKSNGIDFPSEGEFQQGLIKDMLVSLQGHGHDYMFIADEFGLERKAEFIQDIIEGKPTPIFDYSTGHDNWYTPKNEILYTTHWDSFFTLLCSSKATIKSILDKHPFEGFYCDEKTAIYWCLQD